MKKTATYFFLQCKRSARALPFVIAVTLVLCIGLGLVLNAVIGMEDSEEDKQKITIGIVGNMQEGYLGMGLSVIQTMDISRYVVDIVEMTEEDARQAIKKGEIAAYAVIPMDFVDALMHGQVKKITYVTTSSSIGITSIFKDEMLKAISVMMVESQNGIYGLQNALNSNKLYQDFYKHTDALSIDYFTLILGRSSTYEEKIIDTSDQMSFAGYMFSGVSVLMLFLCGVSCCHLFVKKDLSLPKLLRAEGYSAMGQILGEYGAYFLLMLVNVCVIVAAVVAFAPDLPGMIPELAVFSKTEILLLPLQLVPALLLITAIQFLLFEVSSNVVNGVLSQFVAAIALCYVGGCFYPINFFSDSIQALAQLLPSGMARGYLSACVTNGETLMATMIMMVVPAGVLVLSSAIRSQRIACK